MPAKEPELLLLGKAIREFREKRGYSQDKFAFHAGVGRSYYGSLERGASTFGMPNNQLINGCCLPETLSLFTKLKAYSGLALDMVVIEGSNYKDVVRCVFDLNGLKAGLEIDNISGECEVYGFIRRSMDTQSHSSSANVGTDAEAICKIGSSHQALIFDYLEAKGSSPVNFKDFYNPDATGLGKLINMSIHA